MAVRGSRDGAGGFTLIETMIAMFLLSFMVAELAMVDIGAKRSATLARRVVKANALADDAVEKSRNRAYANLQLAIADLGEACVLAGTVATCTSAAPIEGVFTRVRTVTPYLQTYAGGTITRTATSLTLSNIADVQVTVTFNDERGNPRRVSVASVATKF